MDQLYPQGAEQLFITYKNIHVMQDSFQNKDPRWTAAPTIVQSMIDNLGESWYDYPAVNRPFSIPSSRPICTCKWST